MTILTTASWETNLGEALRDNCNNGYETSSQGTATGYPLWGSTTKTAKTQTKVKVAGTGVQHFDGSVLIRMALNPHPTNSLSNFEKVVHTSHSYIIKGGITELITSYNHLGKAKIRGALIGCTVAMVPYYVEKITMACLLMFVLIKCFSRIFINRTKASMFKQVPSLRNLGFAVPSKIRTTYAQ